MSPFALPLTVQGLAQAEEYHFFSDLSPPGLETVIIQMFPGRDASLLKVIKHGVAVKQGGDRSGKKFAKKPFM
jgi:hypothetical protein